VTYFMTSRMRGLDSRLTKLTHTKTERPVIVFSRKDITRAALSKLSTADRDLLQTPEHVEDIQDQRLVNAWKAALAAASVEAGVICIYLSPEERGWL
jgi:hypothetical protein